MAVIIPQKLANQRQVNSSDFVFRMALFYHILLGLSYRLDKTPIIMYYTENTRFLTIREGGRHERCQREYG